MSSISSRTPLALCVLLAGGQLHATEAEAERSNEAALEEITVVGSNIAGGGAENW